MPPENHECEMVRQSQRQHFVDQDKSTASRNRSKTKKIVLDWSYAKKTPIQHHKTSPDMEAGVHGTPKGRGREDDQETRDGETDVKKMGYSAPGRKLSPWRNAGSTSGELSSVAHAPSE